jgi:hypothetical protein
VAARPKPLNEEDVSKIIDREIQEGRLLPSNHFRVRMRERNFDMQDAVAVLEERRKIKAVWNDNANSWNYDVGGQDLDGCDLTIRIAPTDDDSGIVLVTGF